MNLPRQTFILITGNLAIPILQQIAQAILTPTYTYKDSGTYPVKLVINRGEQCSDSTTSKALVYPGLYQILK